MKAIIITGASKGFGRAVAIACAKQFQSPLYFVLNGRDEGDLLDTKRMIESNRNSSALTYSDIVVSDLAQINSLDSVMPQLFDFSNKEGVEFEEVYFFNNAGSLGTLATIGSDAHNILDISTAINLNVTSSCYLTQELMKRYVCSS